MRFAILLLPFLVAPVYAQQSKVVEVPASRVAQMTEAEKEAAKAYAKANGIRWRIDHSR